MVIETHFVLLWISCSSTDMSYPVLLWVAPSAPHIVLCICAPLPPPPPSLKAEFQVSAGEAPILKPLHKMEIFYNRIKVVLWNARTISRTAGAPSPLLCTPPSKKYQGTQTS